jgi:hypothetical protein
MGMKQTIGDPNYGIMGSVDGLIEVDGTEYRLSISLGDWADDNGFQWRTTDELVTRLWSKKVLYRLLEKGTNQNL